MMAILLILFILTCAYLFLRSLNRMFGFITRKPKPFKPLPIVKKEPASYPAEEIKPEPAPQIVNIQNYYNTTQILIIDNLPKE